MSKINAKASSSTAKAAVPSAPKTNGVNKNATSEKSRGKQKAIEDPMLDYWLDLIRGVTQNEDLDAEIVEDLINGIRDEFEGQFDPSEQERFKRALDEIEDESGSDHTAAKKRVKRLERKIAEKQEQIDTSKARVKSFKKSREIQEKEERTEQAKKLHPWARAFLSDDVGQQSKLPAGVYAALDQQKRSIETKLDEWDVYDPSEDQFLQDLAEKLDPVLEKLKKRKKKR